MQPDYASVVDPSSLISTGIPMLIHAFVVALEAAVALHFLVHGALSVRGGAPGPRLLRLGVRIPEAPGAARGLGALQMTIGGAMLLPLALGAPPAVSAIALVAGVSYAGRLVTSGEATGRIALSVVCAASAVVFGFLVFEGRDPARQTWDVVTKAIEWRDHELGWQLAHDVDSPKIGDLAPDFELQDPAGERSIRLSTFRGKRPVALVFGSYT